VILVESLWTQLSPMVLRLLEILSVAALSILIAWLKKRFDLEKNHIAISLLDRAHIVMRTVVASVHNTVAEELRKAAADGKLSEEEGKLLKEKAIQAFKIQFGKEAIKCIEPMIEDIEGWIADLVEETLADIKKG